jgi:hypothetical protein
MNCINCLITKLTPLSYIQEWVNWYIYSIGFDKIFIYDGNETSDIVDTYKNNKHVFVINWSGKFNQLSAYRNFLDIIKIQGFDPTDTWVTNFDDDELLMIEDNNIKIKDLLKKHMTQSLGINMLHFGSNNLNNNIGGSQIDAFQKRTHVSHPSNNVIKMISRFDKIDDFNCVFTHNARTLTTTIEGHECSHIETKNPIDNKIWCNHYFTRSKSEFLNKINRGRADYSDAPKRSIMDFELIDNNSYIEDTRAINRKTLYM